MTEQIANRDAGLRRSAPIDQRAIEAGEGKEESDLRGLEAVSYTDPAGLRRATLSFRQVEHLAPALAVALGIRVDD